jgi:hypothetical protein
VRLEAAGVFVARAWFDASGALSNRGDSGSSAIIAAIPVVLAPAFIALAVPGDTILVIMRRASALILE